MQQARQLIAAFLHRTAATLAPHPVSPAMWRKGADGAAGADPGYLNAFAVSASLDQLAGLYENIAARLSALEATVAKLKLASETDGSSRAETNENRG